MNAIHNFVPEPQDEKVTIQCSASKSNYKKFFDDTTTYPSDGFDVSKFPWTYGVNWDKTAPIVAAKVKMNSEEFKNLAEARLNCQIVAANVHIDHEKPNIGMVDFRIKAIKD
ncbi:uncharacterized protein LOC134856229 [Symsagittifera roscoffensis]|uniref:uncharacterized protein LOC134856229 n=1 Tax=Symsagittifera roscoffensis TaxID=84072 RepID=UPI00307C8E38